MISGSRLKEWEWEPREGKSGGVGVRSLLARLQPAHPERCSQQAGHLEPNPPPSAPPGPPPAGPVHTALAVTPGRGPVTGQERARGVRGGVPGGGGGLPPPAQGNSAPPPKPQALLLLSHLLALAPGAPFLLPQPSLDSLLPSALPRPEPASLRP